MEGLEAMSAEDVSGLGQAAKIIAWMRRECPDMVSVAPLLKELRFTGFSDSRFVRIVLFLFLYRISETSCQVQHIGSDQIIIRTDRNQHRSGSGSEHMI